MKRLLLVVFALAALTAVIPASAQEIAGVVRAELISPTPGSTLPGATVTFTWSAGQGGTADSDLGTLQGYSLLVGTSLGDADVFGWRGGRELSVEVANLPTDGSTVYVRLVTNVGISAAFNDYTFTASGAPAEVVAVAKAELISPTPGSTLPGATVTFAWDQGQGVSEYGYKVGLTRGGDELGGGRLGASLSVEVAGLPTDGSTIYLRLFSRFPSGWEFNDYTFTAAGTGASPEAVVDLVKAALISPTPGSTLPGGTVTFAWSAGTGVSGYAMRVGTSAGGYDLFRGSLGDRVSAEVTGLPTDGSTIYLRLFSRFPSGWEFNDYTFTAASHSAPTSTETVQPRSSGTQDRVVAAFKVELSNEPGETDLHDVSVGQLQLEYPDDSVTGDFRGSSTPLLDIGEIILVGDFVASGGKVRSAGSDTNDFAVDLNDDIVRVEISPLIFPLFLSDDGRGTRRYGAGPADSVTIRFTQLYQESSAGQVQAWFDDALAGAAQRQNFTLNALDPKDPTGSVASWSFFDCQMITYSPLLAGLAGRGVATVEYSMECDRVEFGSGGPHPGARDAIVAQLSGTDTGVGPDISITLVDAEGVDIRTYVYRDNVVARYEWPVFDARQSDVTALETFAFQPNAYELP